MLHMFGGKAGCPGIKRTVVKYYKSVLAVKYILV